MIEKQKKAEGEALISTVLFDNTSEVIHDRVSVQNIKPMTDDDYTVRGCTALLDAIGGAIHHIGNVHKYARAEDVPEHTMFVITTDGMENASRRYDSEKVKKMIERQKEKYGWEFLFLGANIDAVETAIGYVPKPEDINLEGLKDFDEEKLASILKVDNAKWAKEAAGVEEFYKKFGDKLPQELRDELNGLEERTKA